MLVCSLVSGVISDMGSLAREKSGFKEGDEVMALVGGGGYAGAYIHDCLTLSLVVKPLPVRILCGSLPSGVENSQVSQHDRSCRIE